MILATCGGSEFEFFEILMESIPKSFLLAIQKWKQILKDSFSSGDTVISSFTIILYILYFVMTSSNNYDNNGHFWTEFTLTNAIN